MRALRETVASIADSRHCSMVEQFASHAVSLHKDLVVEPRTLPDGSILGLAVHGTPSDCVKMAFTILDRSPTSSSRHQRRMNVGNSIFYPALSEPSKAPCSTHRRRASMQTLGDVNPTGTRRVARHVLQWVLRPPQPAPPQCKYSNTHTMN
jgi:hypothetical protein